MNNSEKSIEDEIRKYDSQLKELAVKRVEINDLKKAKDKLVKQYIIDTKAPKSLNIELLNYKALLFYFKDSFIKRSLILKLADYEKNGKLEANFINFFLDKKIELNKIKWINFPHLIGIGDKKIDEFLDGIFYETNLIEDFKTHKGNVDKIKTFSWIYATLQNPKYIFDKDGIKENRKFKSDLIFVRRITRNSEYYWHVVGLGKESNGFFIQSQYPIMGSENGLYNQFKSRKKIYERG